MRLGQALQQRSAEPGDERRAEEDEQDAAWHGYLDAESRLEVRDA